MATVLITGTSTGIGLATALTLGRAGHKVFATMRNPAATPDLQTLATREGLPIEVLPLDVDSDAAVRTVVDSILSADEPLDALVNNAGIGEIGPIEELPLDAFRRTMETNFFGALRCIKAVLPSMHERQHGCIVNITSMAGRIAFVPMATYATAKFALEALSEVLAQEVKPFKIRVAIIEPGVIQTPIFAKMRSIPPDTHYPHERRLHALFAAAFPTATPPSAVGEQIRQIIEGESWQLRYPVGPDAAPFLAWRASMTDEAWIELNGADDETWCRRIQNDFGLDVQAELTSRQAPPQRFAIG
jgi:NAD(P)-dependent dehydrogenase (short-subunit alcohol dehydrogenase family)